MFVWFNCITYSYGDIPPIFKHLKNYDTLAVAGYFKNGGSVDVVYTNKIKKSSKLTINTKKTSITLIEQAIRSYIESKFENDNDKIRAARKNLDLVIQQLPFSSNVTEQVNRVFTQIIPIGEIDLIRSLVELGADINTRCKMCFGRPAILIAISYHDNFELIKYLLSLKPDLTITDYDGKGFLAYAAHVGNLQLIQYFIEELDAEINIKDNKGNTPLLTAAEAGEYDVFNYLVEKGAELHVVNKKNENVLHKAAYSDNEIFFRHVLYLTGYDLWSKKWNVPNVIKYTDSEYIRTFIIRYTIDQFGNKKYKKLKRKNFFKRLTGN